MWLFLDIHSRDRVSLLVSIVLFAMYLDFKYLLSTISLLK